MMRAGRTPCAEGGAMSERDWLTSWREAQKAAEEAEAQLARLGQAAPDPRAAELMLRAKELREVADGVLEQMLVKSGAKRATPKA